MISYNFRETPYKERQGTRFNIQFKFFISSCLFFIFFSVNAQTPISLQEAIDTALVNNRTVKNERLRSEYQQQLINSGTIIPATEILGEYGQINSVYNDTRIGISQTISFPKVYTRQKELLNEEWKSSVLNVNVQEAQLVKQVSQVFYTLVYFNQKKELLQKTDALFSEFLQKATLRFKAGESNILEKTTAENQRGQIALQLQQLEQDIAILHLHFQLLLNTDTAFSPVAEPFHDLIPNPDTNILISHPEMKWWFHRKEIAEANTRIEKSKLLPDISLAYNIMGMRGVNANDKMYDATPQFHSVQVGLGIPIFTGGQKAKINASKINESLAMNEYEAKLQQFEKEYRSAFLTYQKYSDAVYFYEKTALQNAENITKTANIQFLNGEINYLEWVLLTNQAIVIQSDYIQAVNDRNQAVTELNFYNYKK